MKITKIRNLKSLKSKLKKALPNHILRVIQSYENFLEQQAPEDAKGFSAHHGACKSAVVHIETLLKLAKWTESDDDFALQNDELDITGLISEAREEIDNLEDEED